MTLYGRTIGLQKDIRGPRRVACAALVAALLVGGSLLHEERAGDPVKPQFHGEPSKTLIGIEAATHAKVTVLSLPENAPARVAYEEMLRRTRALGADPANSIAIEFKVTPAAPKESRIGAAVRRLGGIAPVHAQQHVYTEDTITIYTTPFESDSYDGTAEFNVYAYDSDSGSWAQADIQLHTADDAPDNVDDATTGSNPGIAFYNCAPRLDHARNRVLEFFTPGLRAQNTWQGIQCNNDSDLSWRLLGEVRNGVGAGIGAAFGSWAARVCRMTGPGFWTCAGTVGYGGMASYIFYQFGSFVYNCRCRYMGGNACI